MIDGLDLELVRHLSPDEKRRLTARLLRERSGAAAQPYPLSHNQRALFVLHQLAPHSAAYNVTFPLHCLDKVDGEALQRACQCLVDRHPLLRSRYFETSGEPMQAVMPPGEVDFRQMDLRGLTETEQRQRLDESYRHPFDLSAGRPARFILATLAEGNQVFMPVVHHIAIDGQSILICLRELAALYRQCAEGIPARLPLLTSGYDDFVLWQQRLLEGPDGDRLWHYWHERLGGALPVLDLPTDFPRPPVRSELGRTLTIRVDPHRTARLKSLARNQGVTLFTLLLAVYQVWLHRHCGQDNILVGCLDGSRPGAEFTQVVGYFVNPTVLRSKVSGDLPFSTLLGALAGDVVEAFAHREMPFGLLLERLGLVHDPSRTPLFQAAFNFLHLYNQKALEDLFTPPLPGQAAIEGEWGGLRVLPFEMAQQEGQFDIVLDLFEARGGLYGTLKYNSGLYLPATMERWWEHFMRLVDAVLDAPEQRIGHLPLLGEAERRLVVATWNATASAYPREASIPGLFEEQAIRRPDAVALQYGDHVMTYLELNDLADRLAARLVNAGLVAETPVAVFLERGFELVVAFLAVLKAGGAFVPLDVNYPRQRLRYLLADVNASWLLTRDELRGQLPDHDLRVLPVDCRDLAAESLAPPRGLLIGPEQLAYVMYTSGSTGGPKGVMATHRNVVRLVKNTNHMQLGEEEVFLLFAPVAFDASTLEIWGPLLNGGRLVIAPPGLASIHEIGTLVQEAKVTTLWLSTALFHQVVHQLPPWLAGLRQVLTGGETLSPQSVQRLLQGPAPKRLVNYYGPTENTTFSTFYPIPAGFDPSRPVPIGKPIANSTVYIVDSCMNPVPIGIPGELLTGGDGVARGYLNRPQLQAEKFIADPFSPIANARLYRTGDQARFLPDGNIEFLGRLDRQVKIRGFRIELAEIEEAILGLDSVAECAVLAHPGSDGGNRLIAYVVAKHAAHSLSIRELRRGLEPLLPDYMIPARLVQLDGLPLNAHGKIDRIALPAPEMDAEGAYQAPRNAIEEILCGVWADLLEVERVGITDNFFELGGHSLASMRLAARLRDTFRVEIPLAQLFECVTPEAQARLLADKATNHVEAAPLVAEIPPATSGPLSFSQRRLWFLDRLEGPSSLYNIPLAFQLRGPLDAKALEEALNDVLARHAALRTIFSEQEGRPVAHYREQAVVPLPIRTLDPAEVGTDNHNLAERLAREAAPPFNLDRDTLVRATLFRQGEQDHVLLLVIHHIVADGWSLTIFCHEISARYAARLGRQGEPLAPLPIAYADYVLWQRRHLAGAEMERQLAYWQGRLQGAPALLALPTDRPRPAILSHRGASVDFTLPSSLLGRLQALARQHQATLFMTLQAAFLVLLARQSGEEDLVVGTPVANRQRAELEGLIGLFVDLLVLRTRVDPDASFSELLQQVRADALDAYAHQQVPFERIIDALGLERNLSHTPLVQVVFQLENASPAPLALADLAVLPVPIAGATAKFDLTLTLVVSEDCLEGRVEFRSDLFDAPTIHRFIGQYRTILSGVSEDPDRKVAALNLLPEDERALLRTWSAGGPLPMSEGPSASWCELAKDHADVPHSLHGGFEKQAALHPEAVAVRFDDCSLSYQELNRRANRLARRLRAIGVGRGHLVGLFSERCPELVVGIVGILKAGAAYVPLDPAYPMERLAFMAEDAELTAVVITQGQGDPVLSPAWDGAIPMVRLDPAEPVPGKEEDTAPLDLATPNSLAYVIYTSGSTGRPKGVLVAHRQAVRLFSASRPWFQFGSDDVWTMFHSYAFDFSVWELWGALLHGGCLVVVPQEVSQNPDFLLHLLRREGVTVLNQTPSAFRQLVTALAAETGTLPALRWIIFGGEPLDLQAVRIWMQRFGDRRPRLVNMYGITETTVHVTCRPLSGANLTCGSPIGRPLADLQVHVLDREMQPVPIGVPGEMYVGGAGVARGYLRRPELNRARFLDDPFSGLPGARLYRTGDLARWRADGELEYLGRGDNQVKIRGFRVEPGEIEAQLATHPDLAAALVSAYDAGETGVRLVAHVVPLPERIPVVEDLRHHLQQRLPHFMIPAAFMVLDALPQTPSGKIDRRALPLPTPERPQLHQEYAAPSTPEEKRLAEVWRKVLQLDRVGIYDNFFDLGGDSILSIQIMAGAARQGLAFGLQTLFQHQTIRQLAAALGKQAAPETGSSYRPLSLLGPEDIARLPDDVEDAYPLAALQAGMIFHSEFDKRTDTYHDLLSLYLEAAYDPAALATAAERLVARHSILRSSFDLAAAGHPVQRVHRHAELPLTVEDWRGQSEEEQERNLATWFAEERLRPFSWDQPPLARLFLRRRGERRFELSLSVHHAVLDGWSAATFFASLLREYLAMAETAGLSTSADRQNRETPFFQEGAGPAPYAEFIALEQQALADPSGWAFWQRQLEDATPTRLSSRPAVPFSSNPDLVWPVPIPLATSDALKQLAKQAGASLKSVLLTAHLYVLGLWSGEHDVLTGLVSNGRPETAGGEQTLGLFLNTLPFRHKLQPRPWLEMIRAIAAQERDLLPHRRCPLAEIQRRHGGELIETVFNFIHFHVLKDILADARIRVLKERGLARTNLPLAAEFSLDVNRRDAITLRLSVHAGYLDEGQLAALAALYRGTLEEMCRAPEEFPHVGRILPPDQWRQVTADFADGPDEPLPTLPVHDLVAAQAKRRPAALAVLTDSDRFTYGQLAARLEDRARKLAGCGVTTSVLVGVALERGAEAVITLLAILKAGGAYLPLEPSYPKERLAYILNDAKPALVLTQRALLPLLPETTCRLLCLEDLQAPANGQEMPALPAVPPEQLAYVIYTSGSTGRPKGVLLAHRGLSNLVQAQGEAFNVLPGARVLQFARLGFDASVSEIFVTLAAGATLVLAPPGELLAGEELAERLRKQAVNIVTLPPSALATLPDMDLPELHTLVLAGEACPAHLAARWAQGRRLLNAYGPTEITVCATIAVNPDPAGQLPIGRPIANTQVYIMDALGQILPPGAKGEICLGGVGVALGYLGRPDLTSERFVPSPLDKNKRLYRTGDLGRWRPDGQLEFLGRLDDQVKIRGHRIEPGEIEAHLLAHPAVDECLVTVRETPPGSPSLVAYLSAGDRPLEAAELHRFLRTSLPDFMIPSAFEIFETLPHNAHGKIDRQALVSASGRALPAGNALPPRTSTERVLATIWSEVLRIPRIGVRDNFFELGGDSILSIQAVSKGRGAGLRLTARMIFEHPEIESLAAHIDAADQGNDAEAPVPGKKALKEMPLPPALAATLAVRYPGHQDAYPLTPLQQGLLFESLYAQEENGIYFEQPRLHLHGELDPERLRQAFELVLQRHDILRAAVLHKETDTPLQVICHGVALPWQEHDWRGLPDEGWQERLERFLREDRALGFDFERAPLWRLALIRQADRDWLLLVSNHHLLLDGWSLPIVLGEAFSLYRMLGGNATAKLPPAYPFRNYVAWLASRDMSAAETFWRQHLSGCSEPAALDLPAPEIAASGYGEIALHLEEKASQALQGLGRGLGLTQGSICLGAWVLLLSRYTRSEEVVCGVTVSGRPPELAGVERMVGLFINTIPVRVVIDEEQPMASWLTALQMTQAEARDHAHMPLADIRRLAGVMPGQSWFDSLLIMENYPVDNSIAGDDEPRIVGASADERTHYPLTVLVVPGDRLQLRLVYARARFEEESVKRLAGHLGCLLHAMAASPSARLRDLEHLPDSERHEICQTFNATDQPLPKPSCLHQGFEEQARRTPSAVALVDGARRWQYRELDARANHLAWLLQQQGIGPESLVGIYSHRCPAMIVGILAVLKAGGAYVPMDPDYPAARVRYILANARPSLVLTQSALAADLPAETPTLCLDAEWPAGDHHHDRPPASGVMADNLAYVMYTSGSTGHPKGVAVEHGNAVALMGWAEQAISPEELAGVLFSTSICFDLSIFELFAPLWHGGKVMLAGNALEFHDLPNQDEVTLINTVPSAMTGLLNLGNLPETVRCVILCGEAVSDQIAQRIYRQPGPPRLLNLYGPTEDTVYSTWGEGDPERDIAPPIGRPLANGRAYVLDLLMRPQPIGVPGELYLGGSGLARGYLHRQDLTAERFVGNPFDPTPGSRLYRTGDLCRWRRDGQLEYLGRLDHQVKLRGFRIELGEIENTLHRHPLVREAVVIARDDLAGGLRLVAYVVAHPGAVAAAQTLHEHLAEVLPEYMLPGAWVFLDELPLTPNGKLDRRGLPVPDHQPLPSDAVAAPRTEHEQMLCAVWSELFKQPVLGINENFFALGGDSILAIQLVSKARQAGWQISVRQVFQHPTVAELAKQLTPYRPEGRAPAPGAAIGSAACLTPIQQWFFSLRQPEPHHFNQALLLATHEPLAPDLLRQALGHLVDHHDALRQRFTPIDDTARVDYLETDIAPDCAFLDLSGVADADLPAVIAAAADTAQRSLNLHEGPLLRAVSMDLGPERPGRLLLIIHHLAVDWVSWWILLDDLWRVYGQLGHSMRPQLPPGTTPYRTWAAYLVAHARAAEAELDYWRAVPMPSPLPVDFPDGDNLMASARELAVSLSAEETRRLLEAVPDVYRTRIDDILLAALIQAIHAWCGRTALQLDVESHGREELDDQLDLSRSVGWFTALSPVRLALPPSKEAGDRLKSIKEQLRRVPRRGIGYGILRYLHPDPAIRRELAEFPQSALCFNYLGHTDQSLPGSNLFSFAPESVGQSHSPLRRRPYLLDVNGYLADGRFHCRFMYSENLHRADTIAELGHQFLLALRQLIDHCVADGAGGRTPSDFPMALVGQREIDRLVGTGREVMDIFPLTPMQQGLLFHSLDRPDSGLYVEQLVLDLEGDLEPESLHHAWEGLLTRHAALRTGFAWDGLTQPLQIVHRRPRLCWQELDWHGSEETSADSLLEEWLLSDRHRGYDPARPPLLRLACIRLNASKWRLLWSHHHLILDGWSRAILLKELFDLYAGRPLPPAPRPFRDYLAWMENQDQRAAETYWRGYLGDVRTATPLPLKPRPHLRPEQQPSGPAMTVQGRLSLNEGQAVERCLRRHGLTWNTLARGAWALLLADFNGVDEVIFGTTVAGRPDSLSGVDAMVGMFVNTVPVRVRIPLESTTLPWLRELQDQQAEQATFAYSSLADIHDWSGLDADQALFETLLVMENYPVDAALAAGDLPLRLVGQQSRERSNFPLVAMVLPGSAPALHLSYDPAWFTAEEAACLLAHWQHRLLSLRRSLEMPPLEAGSATDCPVEAKWAGMRLGDLDPLQPEERQRMVVDWNKTAVDFPEECCLHELFERQAARNPDATALLFGESSLSYADLNLRAEHLAGRLRQRGIGPEDRVGLCAERSLEMVIGLLAILKAGAAYLPLDPGYPAPRLRFMIEDAGLALLLVQPELRGLLPDTAGPLFNLEMPPALPCPPSGVRRVGPDNAAYLIYTSGSTGQPKGVLLEHRGACNLAFAQQRSFGVTTGTRVLQFASLSFDAATWEIIMALCAGGTLCLAPADDLLPGLELARLLRTQAIEIATLPPSALAALPDKPFPALHTLIVAGEACPPELVDRWAPGRRFFNAYGPTETTVCATFAECHAGQGHPPIGRPIANTRVYVLDSLGRPAPQGTVGELFIGGVGVARGYVNRPHLTQERFLADPFSDQPGRRLYRTGDLCRWRPNGQLEYLGRADHQVKIRGFRIEPGEIESLLRQEESVAEAVVIGTGTGKGGMRLVAYLVAKPTAQPDLEALRQNLRQQLPAYMIPSAFVMLPALPLTANGKLDRSALPSPGPQGGDDEHSEAGTNPSVDLIAEIFADVLGRERVGPTDDFFKLGGHSLLATQVQWRLKAACQVELPLRALFDAPTPATLAGRVEAARRTESAVAMPPLLARSATVTNLPLSFAQERLYFMDQLEPGSALFNSACAVRLQGNLDLEALEFSLREILRRHEVLRTTFDAIHGEPFQVISKEAVLSLTLLALRDLNGPEPERQLAANLKAACTMPFDLTRGPLARFTVLRLNPDEHILAAVFHHTVFDGWSAAVFFRELAVGYRAHLQGKNMPHQPLPIQYADYALWQRSWLHSGILAEEAAYWQARLAGAEPCMLPTDKPRPSMQSYRGARVDITLEAKQVRDLIRLGRRENATLFMTLLTSFYILLHRYTDQSDIVIGTPVAGRNQPELADMIGCFINLLPLRLDLSGEPHFRQLLARVRDLTLDAYAHQSVPFEQLVVQLVPDRDLGRSPLFQVMFALQNLPAPSTELPGLRLFPVPLESEVAQYDLSLNLSETNGSIQGELEYNSDLFLAETAQGMVRHWLTLLAGILKDPDCAIDRLPMIEEHECRQLLQCATAVPGVPVNWEALSHRFARQAMQTPNAIAIATGTASSTYDDLHGRVKRLADRLADFQLATGEIVALCLDRSPQLIMAMLAVLEAGGAYLPLDPDSPPQRLTWLLEDSHARLLVTTRDCTFAAMTAVTTWYLDDDTEADGHQRQAMASRPAISPEQPACLIYTSGSTGSPKGVLVPHRALLNHATWASRAFVLQPGDRVLQFASASFDVAAEEIFPTLISGATLVLRDDEALAPDRFGPWVRDQGISVLNLPTAFWHTWTNWLADAGSRVPESLRLLVVGGERVTRTTLATWRSLKGAEQVRWLNAYGPTETSITATVYEAANDRPNEKDSDPPIGLPIDNLRTYVLDRHRQPLPDGIPGELYIGGAGVALGYHHRPELTEAAFVPDPFSDRAEARLFKSGDLCRRRSDGNLEFLGRCDQQLKIRGYRIEPSEIEAVLQRHQGISAAVVDLQEVRGEPRLTAYLVARGARESLDPRAYLQDQVPAYMIPESFVWLTTLPLTPSGKVDRRALPLPDPETEKRTGAPLLPRNATEQGLAAIWSEVLGIDPVGVRDDFYVLGGHSLLALRTIALIAERFGQHVPLTAMFQGATIETLARRLRAAGGPSDERSNMAPASAPRVDHGRPPLFLVAPALSSGLCYGPLASHLGDDPQIWTLTADRFDLPATSDLTVMAGQYIAALRARQPHGPYLLGGWSLGGVIAFAMAQQLQAQGDPVSRLILIDSVAPGARPDPYRRPEDAQAWLRQYCLGHGVDLTRELDQGQNTASCLQQAAFSLIRAGIFHPPFDAVQLQQRMAVAAAQLDGAASYDPPARLTAETVLLRAADLSRAESPLPDLLREETMGWARYCRHPVQVRQMAGDHHTLLQEPWVRKLALHVREHLQAPANAT